MAVETRSCFLTLIQVNGIRYKYIIILIHSQGLNILVEKFLTDQFYFSFKKALTFLDAQKLKRLRGVKESLNEYKLSFNALKKITHIH